MGYTTQYAGNLVGLAKMPGASGLSWDQAFAAISSAPARAVGMGDRLGSLKPGHVGDVVMWDQDPLELGSRPTMVWIDGKRQSLTTRQDCLRDRYVDPVGGSLRTEEHTSALSSLMRHSSAVICLYKKNQ